MLPAHKIRQEIGEDDPAVYKMGDHKAFINLRSQDIKAWQVLYLVMEEGFRLDDFEWAGQKEKWNTLTLVMLKDLQWKSWNRFRFTWDKEIKK
jgi:hypothetical protein